MSRFGRREKKEMLEQATRDVGIAERAAGEAMANMHASGIDVDALMHQAAGQPAAMNDIVAMSRNAAGLMNNGVEMAATVRSVDVGPASPATGGAVPVSFQLTVEPPGRAVYDVATHQLMVATMAAQIVVSKRVTVRVAPDDPQTVMVWDAEKAPGAAAPTPAASGETERVERLAKIQALHSAGAITDAEFAEQKARILSE